MTLPLSEPSGVTWHRAMFISVCACRKERTWSGYNVKTEKEYQEQHFTQPSSASMATIRIWHILSATTMPAEVLGFISPSGVLSVIAALATKEHFSIMYMVVRTGGW